MQFQQQLTSNLNMRFITRRLVSLLVVLMVFTMISSTSNVDNKEGAIASTLYEDEPVYHMFYWPSRGRSPQRHGILFAVWEDGKSVV